ncbi:MAG: nickel-dependent lactate racemase [Actinobacteria bacterium]|nr:nickel-dependent lactate racemase [Actinomycetota bacterium]
MKRLVFCGDDIVQVDIPDHTRVLRAPEPLPGLVDYEAEVRRALRNPAGTKPLGELVGGNSRVTIAFDDPCLPLPPLRNDPRGRAVGVILEELISAGVDTNNVSLICAIGLHRKWTHRELRSILGKRVWSELGPVRITNHDSEDPDRMVDLGSSGGGHPVRVNRAVTESDLLIYVNVNWTSMNGGWKSIIVGLGDYESIRAHHNVKVLSEGGSVMDTGSKFHEVICDMGKTVGASARVFTVETTLNNRIWGPFLEGFFSLEGANPRLPHRLLAHVPGPSKNAVSTLLRGAYQPVAVNAGSVDEVHDATLQTLFQQQNVKVEGQTDALLVGVPNLSPYSSFSRINPLLAANTALGYVFNMHIGKPPVRKGGVMILAQPFLPGFKQVHHPSYVEFFDRVLPETLDPREMEEGFEEEFARRPEYIRLYRFGHAYHGVHPFYVWYWCSLALKHLERVIVAGAVDHSIPGRMGFESVDTVEEALDRAGETLGKDFSLTHLVIPPIFATEVL